MKYIIDIKKCIENLSLILSEDIMIDFLDDTREIINSITEITPYIKAIQYFKDLNDIPSKLFWSKLERFISGISDIPTAKRKQYIYKIGKQKNEKDIERMFNIINHINEKEKMQYLANLYKALLNDEINITEFFRMSTILSSALYEDLIYLKDNISDRNFSLNEHTSSLLSSSLVIFESATWQIVVGENNTGGNNAYKFTNLAKQLCKYAIK